MIDPRIEYVGASRLRTLNTSNLGKLEKTLVIQDNDTPLAVLLNYDQYMMLQNKLQQALDRIEVLSSNEAANALRAGFDDIEKGHHTSLSEIDPAFKVK